MTTPTPLATPRASRWLPLTAATLCTAGALYILLEDVIAHAAPWTLKHGLTVITVAVTILVGHLANDARRGRYVLATLGFGLLFVAGTGLTVYNSVGRQAETTFVASTAAEEADTQRTAARKGLAGAEAMLADAQRDLARECKSGKGKRCEGIMATIAVYQSSVKGYKADLDKIGPPKTVVPEAKRLGEIAAVFGFDGKKVEAGAILTVPFLMALFLEFGAIVCFGYAFRVVPASTTRNFRAVGDTASPTAKYFAGVDAAELSALRERFFAPESDEQPEGGSNVVRLPIRPKPSAPAAGRKAEVLAGLLTDLAMGKSFPAQTEIADRFGVARSTVSDWLKEWEAAGLIPERRTVGRCKALVSA